MFQTDSKCLHVPQRASTKCSQKPPASEVSPQGEVRHQGEERQAPDLMDQQGGGSGAMEPSVQDWKTKSRESSWSQTEACPERLPGILPSGQGSLSEASRGPMLGLCTGGGVRGRVEEGWKHELQEDAQLQCVPFCLMPLCLCICCSLYPECHSCF